MPTNQRPTDTENYFDISVLANGDDFKIFEKVINMGIDSRLEAFTQSIFFQEKHRFYFYFHNSELPILIRRLKELKNEDADTWVYDIKEAMIAKEDS